MWYRYKQNNTGGSFEIDDKTGIGPVVFVQAFTPEGANKRANEIGIYFNGCTQGFDCDCCGDRWYPAEDFDKSDKVVLHPDYDFWWHNTVYLHYLDGRIERIKNAE